MREVAPGILWLRMPLPFALDHINLWLLADGEGWTQIDCRLWRRATRALWHSHFSATLAARPINRVIATHYHPDHLGNAAWLCARFGCTVAMPQAEYLTAHAIAGEHSGLAARRHVGLFRAHGDERRARLRRSSSEATSTGAAFPELPFSFLRIRRNDEIPIGRQPLARHTRLTDTRPSMPRSTADR